MSFTEREGISPPPPRIFWPLLGLIIVLFAEAATVLVMHIVSNMNGLSLLYLAAPLAALLVGIPIWRSLVILPGRVTIKRGLLAGTAISLLAYPVMWIVVMLVALVQEPGSLASFNPASFILVLIYSLIFGGVFTTLAGASGGFLLIILQRFLTDWPQRRMRREFEDMLRREMGDLE